MKKNQKIDSNIQVSFWTKVFTTALTLNIPCDEKQDVFVVKANWKYELATIVL